MTTRTASTGPVTVGHELPAVHDRGKALRRPSPVLDDDALAQWESVGPALWRWIEALRAEGWTWAPVLYDPTTTATQLREQVRRAYDEDPTRTKTLVLLGPAPVPYSGGVTLAKRAHNQLGDQRGASRTAMTSTTSGPGAPMLPTPSSVCADRRDGSRPGPMITSRPVTASTRPRASWARRCIYPKHLNRIGDGKFDDDRLPSGSVPELTVGRIDFSGIRYAGITKGGPSCSSSPTTSNVTWPSAKGVLPTPTKR